MTELFGFRFDLGKLAKWAATFGVILLGIAWLLYMYVNYITTVESLEYMFGPATWVTVTGLAVCVADLGAMARVFTPETGRKEPRWVAVVTIIWLMVTGFDLILNYYFIAIKMESHNVVTPEAMQGMTHLIPFAIAFLIWAVQVGLAFAVALAIDNAMHRSGGSSTGGFR